MGERERVRKPDEPEKKESVVGKVKSAYGDAKDAAELPGVLFPGSEPKLGPFAQRVEDGLTPFSIPSRGLGEPGGIIPGSSAHMSENLRGKSDGYKGANALKMAWSLGSGVAADLEEGKNPGKNLAKNLGSSVAGSVEGDMLKMSGSGALAKGGGAVSAANAAAKMLGAPEELTGAVDAATMPLSMVSHTISEGAGAHYSILDSAARAAAGDENWLDPLEEHNKQGVQTASPFQPLYWLGEAASGGWDDLANRMTGEEGRTGKMGTFVEAGNYWGDVMWGDRSLSNELSDIGSFLWGGVSGEGGIKGAGKAAGSAIGEAGSYWGDVLTGKGNLGKDLGDSWDFASDWASKNVTLENAQGVAEGITRKVGGDKLVGMTREAGDYWGDVLTGDRSFGSDAKEMADFA